jgi:hypothetical protein
MNFCQRLRGSPDFRVSEEANEAACGKPAKFRSKFREVSLGSDYTVNAGRDVVLWLCAKCFDEYEAYFGRGAWADNSATGNSDYYLEEK